MINNQSNMGYTDVVYAPNYFSSDEGILTPLEDSYDFDLDTYLVFNNQVFKTIDDLKETIVQLLEDNSNIPYNIDIINTNIYDCIKISCVHGSLNIYIPPIQAQDKLIQEQIIRKFLYKDAYLNGRILVYRSPFQSLNELILDMRNIFIK